MRVEPPHSAVNEPNPSAPPGATRCALAVVVLNYRTPDLVLDCLETLVPEMAVGEQVVVVDNDSGDDSASMIGARIEERGWGKLVRLVEAGGNHGFSAGNNVGIRSVDAEAYLLLNSDTLVRPGAIEGLRRAMAAHPEVSLFGPRLEWPDETPQISAFRDPSPLSEFDRAAGTGPVSKVLRRWSVSPPRQEQPVPFAWASFAAILVRRSVFEGIGLMDEGYFLYFEDIDFCRRARLAGFKGLYWPEARIVHLRGGSGPVKESQAQKSALPPYYYASRSRFFAKSYGRFGLFCANLLWMGGRCISILRETLTRKKPHLCAKEGRGIWHRFLRPVDPAESWRGNFPPTA